MSCSDGETVGLFLGILWAVSQILFVMPEVTQAKDVPSPAKLLYHCYLDLLPWCSFFIFRYPFLTDGICVSRYILDSVQTNLYVLFIVYIIEFDHLPKDILVHSFSTFCSMAIFVLFMDYTKTSYSYRSLDEATRLLDTSMTPPSSATTKVETTQVMPADQQKSKEADNTLRHRTIRR